MDLAGDLQRFLPGAEKTGWGRKAAGALADRFIPRRHSVDAGNLLGPRALRRSLTCDVRRPASHDEGGSPPAGPDSPFARAGRRESAGSAGSHTPLRATTHSPRLTRTESVDDAVVAQANRRLSQDRILNFFTPELENRRSSLRSTPRRSGSLCEDKQPGASRHSPYRKMPVQPEACYTFRGVRKDMACNVMAWGRKGALAVAVYTWINLWVPRSGHLPAKVWLPLESSRAADITALAWNLSGSCLAFGNEDGDVWVLENISGDATLARPPVRLRTAPRAAAAPEVWPTQAEPPFDQQVTSLAWNLTTLYMGNKLGHIEYLTQQRSGALCTARGVIYRLAVSPDGKRLAATVSTNEVLVLPLTVGDCTTSGPPHTFTAHSAVTKALSWCPWRPALLATGGCSAGDGYIRVWDAGTGKLLQEAEVGGEEQEMLEILWVASTRELVTAHAGRHAYVLVWPASLSQHPARLSGHNRPVIHLDVSPDGTRLASLSSDGLCNIWHCLHGTSARPRIGSDSTSRLAMCIR